MFTIEQMTQVTAGYIAAMLWSSIDTHPETGEDLESLEAFELSNEACVKAGEICNKFVSQNLIDCKLWAVVLGYEDIGYNLWLNSAGHGVGFWDRDMGKLGDRLSKASEDFTIDCYLGDDNLVYLN